MISIADAISAINPNAVFSTRDNEITWLDGTTPISDEDIQAKKLELENQEEANKQAKADLKASAKAKLIAGEALTEEEANTIVL
tara:strand:- start:660 stop:911 length:252 start_codon:yes stop_codon:yes gene_type:complete